MKIAGSPGLEVLADVAGSLSELVEAAEATNGSRLSERDDSENNEKGISGVTWARGASRHTHPRTAMVPAARVSFMMR